MQCGHWFCKECITDALSMNQHCPLCRALLHPSQLTEAVYPQPATPEVAPEAVASTSRREDNQHVEINSKVDVRCCLLSSGNCLLSLNCAHSWNEPCVSTACSHVHFSVHA